MTILEFGAKDLAEYGTGWKKSEDRQERVFMMVRLTKPLPFGIVKDEDKTTIDAKDADLVFIFGNKNGKASLKAIIDSLSAMLAEWETESEGEDGQR